MLFNQNRESSDSNDTHPNSRWLVLKASLFYFAFVFAVGFVFGPIRILWAVPRFGVRAAELMEMPFMLIAVVAIAYWVISRLFVPSRPLVRLGMGLISLALILAAEFSLVLQLRGLTLAEYWADRDPVSGTAYYLMLCIFALMPWLMARIGV